MRPSLILAAGVVPLLLMACLFGWDRTTNDTTDSLPTLAELEKVDYEAVDSSALESPPYPEVCAARGLFVAYRGGSDAVSKYREPVLTRGAQGVSIFRAVSPAVVVVIVGSVSNRDFDPEGIGTGVIIDPRGFVLTNWHVMTNHADAIIFLKPTAGAELERTHARIARVVYDDPMVDLALLRIVEPPPNLHTIAVGDITQVQVAEDIHIIGHPHGNLWSYSTGVISQIRDEYSWKYEDGSQHLAKVLQLQTAINPGNSGGPAVDDSGRIVGLVAMIEEGQNLDYAIAADVIKRFLFMGMQMNTRGTRGPTPPAVAPRQVFLGKLRTSLQIYKFIYFDTVLYQIQDNRKGIGLVAKFNDGTVVRAWSPDLTGELTAWSATLHNGSELVASAANGALTSMSIKQP